eukprot:sb/3477490/
MGEKCESQDCPIMELTSDHLINGSLTHLRNEDLPLPFTSGEHVKETPYPSTRLLGTRDLVNGNLARARAQINLFKVVLKSLNGNLSSYIRAMSLIVGAGWHGTLTTW